MTEHPPQQPAPELGEDPRNDPAVEEIRAIRRRLWREAGGDTRRYIEQTRERVDRLMRKDSDDTRRTA